MLMVLNGYLLSYSLQLRMFSLLWLTSLFSLWAFASWLKAESPGWRVFTGFLMANLFVVYSHYWGWVLVGCQGLYVLVFTIRKLQQFSLIAGILVVAYLPWAQAVVEGAAKMGSFTSQIAWIGRPTIYDLAWFYSTLQGGLPIRHTTFLGLSLSGIPVFLWAWAAIKYRERAESFRFLTWIALFPVFLTFVMSQVLNQSVWAERSLIICAVPYLLLISVAVCRLPGKAGLAVPLVLMIWAMVAGTDYVSKPHKLPWDSLITRLAQTEAQTPVAIYTLEDFVATPLQFYAIEQGTTEKLRILLVDPQQLGQLHDRQFWIVYREFQGKVWLSTKRPEELFGSERFDRSEIVQIDRGAWSLRAVLLRAK